MRRIALIALAAVELAVVAALPAPPSPPRGALNGIQQAGAQLRGEGPAVDLVQDYVGARHLARGENPYEILAREYTEVGAPLEADHRSTHPPTAFVVVLAVAWLPWKAAAAVWAVLMLAAIGGAWWALGARPEVAAALAPLTLLWPPAAWSLGQLTPLWLLGLALAWRFRNRPDAAGAAIALAAVSKLLPVLMLLPFLLQRRWTALRGFGVASAGALLVVNIFDLRSLYAYVHEGRDTARQQIERLDNSALIPAAAHHYGAAGLALAAALVVAVGVFALLRMRGANDLDRNAWDAWSWVAVALLPVAWIYSMLPLLPALVRGARRASTARALVIPPLVIPFLIDPFGSPGAIWLAVGTAAVGVSVLLLGVLRRDASPDEAAVVSPASPG